MRLRTTVIIVGIIVFVLALSLFALSHLHDETRTSIVAEKYLTDHTSGGVTIPTGEDSPGILIPITTTRYILIMENGDELSVTRDVFVRIRVGDTYTYTVTIWR